MRLSPGQKISMIKVQVIYAEADRHTVLDLDIVENATVQDAIKQSGILEQHAEIDLTKNKIGIYSEVVALDTKVSAGDRIEIYRPLNIDPIEARRLRAQKNKNT